jgi:hypothetical protein
MTTGNQRTNEESAPDSMPQQQGDELPLPDYDHLPTASLSQRIRSLDAAQLEQLIDYETRHGHRLPVLQVMRTRLDELEAGAEPSKGSPAGWAPEAGGSPEQPRAIDQNTAAPTINPPAHGDPTNPAQPR